MESCSIAQAVVQWLVTYVIVVYCSLELLGSNDPPASASQSTKLFFLSTS